MPKRWLFPLLFLAVAALYGQPSGGTFPPASGGGGGGGVSSVGAGCFLTGGPITGSGTISATQVTNAQTGTGYALQNSDCGKLVKRSNASAMGDTLPQAGAGGAFLAGWFGDVFNAGPGTLTITAATSTINGNATLVLASGSGAHLVSEGTNYTAEIFGAFGFFSSYQFGSNTALTGTGQYLQTTYPLIFTLTQTGSGTSGSPYIDAITLANQNANLVFAGPSTGSPAAPGFRSLALADLPILNCAVLSDSKASCSTDTTNAANITSGIFSAARLPNPSASTLGGIQSLAAVSHQWIDSISTLGVPHQSQPNFTDVTGHIAIGQITELATNNCFLYRNNSGALAQFCATDIGSGNVLGVGGSPLQFTGVSNAGGGGGGGGTNIYTANQTLTSSDDKHLVAMDGTSLTATLPASPAATFSTTVQNFNTTDLIVARNGLLINGQSFNITLKQGQRTSLYFDATGWRASVPDAVGVGLLNACGLTGCTHSYNPAAVAGIAPLLQGDVTTAFSVGTNAYIASPASGCSTATLKSGAIIDIIPDTANGVSLNFCGFGIKSIKASDGVSAPNANIAGLAERLQYDGTVWRQVGGSGSTGTVTSVSFTGGLISVATATTTPALTVAGTSGGIPYFASTSTWASSAVLTANLPVIGGGAGVAPSVGTVTGSTTQFATWTGATTTARCVHTDASGNLIIAAADCNAAQAFSALLAGTNAAALLVSGSFGPTGAGTVTANLLSTPSLGTTPVTQTFTCGSGGCTQGLLAKLDASNPSLVVIAGNTETEAIGIFMSTVSASASVEVARYGVVNCIADGTITANDILITGSATSARCRDSGVNNQSGVSMNRQIVGKALANATIGNPVSILLRLDYGGNISNTNGQLPVGNGGTNLSFGTSGGILGYTATGTLASSIALTLNMPVIGGGAGATPTVGTVTGSTTQFATWTGATTASRCVHTDASGNLIIAAADCNTAGVTSVSFTGGLISVATATTTPALTVAGTSGGIPYFASTSTWASSAVLTANLPVIGGGAGVAPSVGTVTGSTTQFATWTGAVTASRCVDTDASGNLHVTTLDCNVANSLTSPSLGTTPITQTYTVGTGGVTAGLLVKLDASNPSLVVAAATTETDAIGFAMTTQSAAASVEVALLGVLTTAVADNTVTAGHVLITGSSTAGRVRDSGVTNQSGVNMNRQVVGRALTSGTVGQTITLYAAFQYGGSVSATNGTLPVGNGGFGSNALMSSGGLITKLNAIATVDYGVGAIYASAHLTGQTATIGTTNLQCGGAVCAAGNYVVRVYTVVSTAGTGTLTTTVAWNDGTAARTTTSAGVAATATNFEQVTYFIKADGVNNITYATTLGTGTYKIDVELERLN